MYALCKEAALRKNDLQGNIDTLYFGGGTPSLLNEQELGSIFEALHRHFSLNASAEITLEANPDDISAEKAGFWKSIGINRLSIGVQAFDDEDLRYLGRRHHAERSRQALNDVAEAGFENISADLIHGIPGSAVEKTLKSIEELKLFGVRHLSMYSLTVEQGTILENRIKKGILSNIDEDEQAMAYLQAVEKAESCGFMQYEISNFCIPGFESKHNSAYWNGAPYLGLGPSAHSFNGETRSWNVADIPQYIAAIDKQQPLFEKETLSATDRYNEFLLTRLRTTKGIQLDEMHRIFGEEAVKSLIHSVHRNSAHHHFNVSKTSVSITRQGLLFADRMISDLMK